MIGSVVEQIPCEFNPDRCQACSGRVVRSPIEAVCSECGLVADAAPLVRSSSLGLDDQGRVVRAIPLAWGPRATFVSRGGGEFGDRLRRAEH
jgi:hypothetical protein